MKQSQKLIKSALLAPITAATTARTANLDCQGANYASIYITVGAEANTNSTNVALSILESDDTTATNFATFSTSASSTTIDNTSAVNGAPYHVDLKGRKRYLRVQLTPDTTTNGAVITSAFALLSKERLSGTESDYGTLLD